MSRARVCLKRGVVVSAAWVVGMCGLAGGVQADRLSVLAKVGDSVDLPNGVSAQITDIYGYNGFTPPVISESGHAAFVVMLSRGPTSTSPAWAILRASPGTVQVAAVQGGNVDGMSGVTFSSLSAPSINSSGEVFFQASITGTGVTQGLNSRGYWAFNGSSRRALVREGVSVPDAFSSLRIGSITEAEIVRDEASSVMSFRASLTNPGSSASVGTGQFALPDTASTGLAHVDVLARLGTAAPGMNGATFSDVQRISGRSGPGMLLSTVTGSGILTNAASPLRIGNEFVLWSIGSTGQLTKVARNGDPAPGFATGMSFYLLSNTTTKPMVNSSGTYAFAATAMSTTATGGSGIWTNRPDVAARGRGTLLARSGDSVATSSGQVALGALFNGFSFKSHWLCEDGTVVFVAPLLGNSINAQNNRAIFSDSPRSGRELVARGGDPVPGIAGATFVNSTIGNWLLTNANGDVAFMAQMTGAGIDNRNDFAIFRYTDGQLQVVAREGQSLPNTDGYTLLDLSWFERWMFNDQGQLVVTASAAQTERGSTASQGCVFRVDEAGGVRALAVGNASIGGFESSNNSLSSFVVANPTGVNNTGRVVGATIGTFDGLYREAIVSVDVLPTTVVPPPPRCLADFNNSGIVGVQDMFDFVEAYLASDILADVNNDATVTVQDLFDFLAVFFGGC